MNLLEKLNDKQREAVTSDKGAFLVIAGAGTGKTRVLTNRIAYLIEKQNAKPWQILSITFTNKAADEMKERIKELVDYEIEKMWIGTFHSICVRILRKDIDRIGYERNYLIYDTQDQKTLLKDCLEELKLDSKKYNINVMKSIISNEKNNRVSPDKYTSNNFGNLYHRNVGEVYALYEKKLKTSNALDFDDLIIKTLTLLERNEDILEFYQNKFKYILVDEYQDTNNVQYNLIKILGKKKNGENNVFVVGDEDQSIYSWRGADINNILNFEKDFEGARTIKLEKNYRSTNVILDAANNVIQNNTQRKGKQLYSDTNEGELIKVLEMDNENDEAFTVASFIRKENRDKNVPYSEMAILYRTNAQSRAIEEGFIREGIPYKIVGGLKFYDRKEIKDIMSYLMLTYNQKDSISFDRIINVPRRKIGDKTIQIISESASEKNISKLEACFDLDSMELTSLARKSIESFVSIIEMLMIKKDAMSLSSFIEAILDDTGYRNMLLEDTTVEGRNRIENVDEFISAAKDFEERYEDNSLEDFLAHLSLLSDVDKTEQTKNNTVKMMTVHSAKGLEYDTVFVTGVEEGTFPILNKDVDGLEDIEEERRLFYVAITRAKRMLYITYAKDRMRFGNHETKMHSRFLKEIPKNCIEENIPSLLANKKINRYKEENYFKRENKYEQSYYNNDDYYESSIQSKKKSVENKPKIKDLSSINVGDKVLHNSWGEGTIVSLKMDGEDTIAAIAFEKKGIKNLMLNYAPIEKIIV